ncbi:MAG: hypothetical protein LBS60_06110 [Deltaproteobacteria bacterium]|jgi:hypothetical protein|nr:hypothetical protein [Deltaproteobacteria bacterium]
MKATNPVKGLPIAGSLVGCSEETRHIIFASSRFEPVRDHLIGSRQPREASLNKERHERLEMGGIQEWSVLAMRQTARQKMRQKMRQIDLASTSK